MTEAWNKEFMEGLSKAFEAYTDEILLKQDANSGLYILRTVFDASGDDRVNVLAQGVAFEAEAGVKELEIIYVLTKELKPETMQEVLKAANELNFISPAGAFGVREKSGQLYLRHCWQISEAPVAEQVKQAVTCYNMMMKCLQGAYTGFEKIWTGELTYDQAVEQKYLNRSNAD